jgi:hypothetical protein
MLRSRYRRKVQLGEAIRMSWWMAALLFACQAVWLLAGANAQDKKQNKAPVVAQKPTLPPGLGEQKTRSPA